MDWTREHRIQNVLSIQKSVDWNQTRSDRRSSIKFCLRQKWMKGSEKRLQKQ